jgi:hypothetical protein
MMKEKQRMAGERMASEGMAGDRKSFGAGYITGGGGGRRQPEQVQLDDPHGQGQMMPQDLAGGYLNLAVPGSPLGQMGLLAGNRLRDSQVTQDAILASQGY